MRIKRSIAIVLAAIIMTALLPIGIMNDAFATSTPYYNWKQYDSQWSGIYIGTKTIGQVGCLATSTAILTVHSGLRNESNMDPGIFVNLMKNVGGFSNNDMYWGKVGSAVPGFNYSQSIGLSGSNANKCSTINSYVNQGYYVIVGVKSCTHWVAVRSASSSSVVMMDPASTSTDLFGYYTGANVTQIRLFTSTGAGPTQPPQQTNESWRITSSNGVNLRNGPSTGNSIVGAIPCGHTVTVTEKATGSGYTWGKTTYNSVTGWFVLDYAEQVSGPSSTPTPTTPPSAPSDEVWRITTAIGVNMRSGAGTSYSIVGAIPCGHEIVVVAKANADGYTWGKTTYNSVTGWFVLDYAVLVSQASYSVVFKDWNGTVLKTQTVTSGNSATPPSNPSREGYSFAGWSGSYTNVTSNRTITATYNINSFTVTFKDWNGSVLKTQTVTYGSNATPPSNPSRTGYNFAGWSGSYTNVTNSRTITATYSINSYTVRFINWDGSVISTQSIEYGGNATPPSNPTRTGYTFTGWSGSYTNVTSNRDITATYSVNSFTVTFKDWNGTVLKTENVNYGGNATPPSNPTRTGYTFTGWSGSYTNVTSNRDITATYSVNSFTVMFKDWNGTVLKTENVNYGGNATPPSNPTRAGYEFTGWSGSYTNVTSNRDITATYSVNSFTVTFKDWNGTVLKTENVNYGGNATPPSNPTRAGYEFTGWSGSYTNVTSDAVITAQYTMVEITEDTPQLNIDTVTGRAGETVTVNVYIKNNPGIVAATLLLTYDTTLLELVKAANGEVISGEGVQIVCSQDVTAMPYSINILSTSTTDYTNDGVIVSLTFKIKEGAAEGASSAISIECPASSTLNVDLDSINLAVVNGSVTVVNTITGDANGDGIVGTVDALLILRYLAGWDIDIDMSASDINGDGVVGMLDAMLVLRYLADWDIPYFD